MISDCKIIRPIAITDAMLVSSTVPEALVSAYAGGTTYALGDRRGVTSGTAQTVYESLQNANTGNTPSSSQLWWKELGVVYAPYAGGTTYALDDIVSNIATDVHELYKSLSNGNIGNALTDETKWLLLGATNRHNAFDNAYNSQTTNADKIVYVIAPGEIANTVSLLNVDAATVKVEQSISGYSRTVSLNSHPVTNWYDWYYEPLIRSGDVVISDIPPYADGVLTITIDNTGDTAKLGCCKIGKSRVLGTTHNDMSRSINDYSQVKEDRWGNLNLQVGAFSKRLNLSVQVQSGFESEVVRLLESLRATPLVVVGSEAVSMSLIYCILGTWEVPMADTGRPATIQFKGMI